MGPETENDALRPRRSGEKGLTGEPKTGEARSAGPWSRGRTLLVLKRILWWAGLVLLLPGPAALYDWEAVCSFFHFFPTRLGVSTTAGRLKLIRLLTDERILATLVAGFVCWALCAILGVVILLRGSVRPAPRHPVWRVARGLIIGLVSFVFLLSASFVGLVLMIAVHV